MIRHHNLFVTVAILFLAAIILAVRMQSDFIRKSRRFCLQPPGKYITIVYGRYINNGANLLDLYLPDHSANSPTVNKKEFPLIVFIHGGAWQSGDKSMVPNPEEFTRRGYALASINYRLTGDAPFPAQIEDCKAAVTWLRSHAKIFRIDPTCIGVWGVSAGGHLAALLGTTCDINSPAWAAPGNNHCQVQAVCDWCGPTDLCTIAKQAGPDFTLSRAIRLLLGGTPEAKPLLAREASPVTYIKKELPPFLIVHGAKDTIVPAEQSREFARALGAARIRPNLKIVPGASHMLANTDTIKQAFRFFDLVLKKNL